MMREVGVKKIYWTVGPEVVAAAGGKLFGEAKVEDLWEEFLEAEGNLVESEWLTMVERGLVQRVREFAEKEGGGGGGGERCCGSAGNSRN